tara:strand:+ start:9706 stop:9933 length:228 start_codon:yes stop_codon:yes gene_type:complete
MKEATILFMKGIFFFLVGATLITLFIWSLAQGALFHGFDSASALFYYFAAVLAGAGGLTLYHQAKYTLHYAKIIR